MTRRESPAGAASVGAQIRELDDRAVAAHADRWAALARDHAALPSQDVPWALAAAEAFGGTSLITVGGPDGLGGIAAVTRHGRRLELLGASELFEPGDLLARSDDALASLAEQLVAQRTPIVLRRLPPTSPTITALREAIGRHGAVRLQEGAGHPVIELDDRWTEPGGGLSSSRRSALRRARRKAERMGPVTVELLAPGPDAVDAPLDEAFDVEHRSWKGAAGTSLRQSPALARFVRRYATEAAARGMLRVELLRIDGRAVAMQIGVEWRRRIWLLKIGYDERYARVSPGQLLLAASIADAAARGLEGYQFQGEPAPWTETWTRDVQPCVTVRAYPMSVAGGLALGSDLQTVVSRRARPYAARVRRAAVRRAASRYVAGPTLDDALAVRSRYASRDYATTVGHWGTHATPRQLVSREYRAAAERLPAGTRLSIKLPALRGDVDVLDALLARCAERQLELHFDALGPESADAAFREAARLAAAAPGTVGCTLPGRWERSVADVAFGVEHRLRCRVVKGEWEDPDAPDRDMVEGFLSVVAGLAGRAPFVAVATHDAALARTALERLVATGTACELELLHGMNGRAALRVAQRLGVPVRIYVPYGEGRVPYDWSRFDPRSVARATLDLLPTGRLRAHLIR